MIKKESFELPLRLKKDFKKATTLEWITMGYLVSVVILMYLVMGSSQAMKTAWLEDSLSILPSISFLIASRIYNRPPTKKFSYGFHRVFSIAYLAGSLALFAMGLFLVIDSTIALVTVEKPTIGAIEIFGVQMWMGWLMILALLYSALPAMWLGFKKLPLAKNLHNKILYVDATTQKADYLTAFAAILGVLGIGLGLWWADALMAIFISVSIIKDGFTNTADAIKDLMDRTPEKLSKHEEDPLVQEIREAVSSWPWVAEARVRFREQGQVYFGEVQLVPNTTLDLPQHIQQGITSLRDYHWKIYDVSITALPSLKDDKD